MWNFFSTIVQFIKEIIVKIFLEKRNSYDLENKKELIEEISINIQELFDLYDNLYSFYQNNFSHIDNVAEAMTYFNRYNNMYKSEYEKINLVFNKMDTINNCLRRGRLCLNRSIVKHIEKYLELGEFSYMTDGTGGFLFHNLYESFFLNLIENKEDMDKQKNKILKKFHKLKK
ncbi:hypothetical protein [Orenia marismortui]|uniref:hypothetical protein n=1 Tax=Orenia marismortui TaxID=46469 RepID=UPI0003601427|nr:hypothetical protein [Orenia marismortui]